MSHLRRFLALIMLTLITGLLTLGVTGAATASASVSSSAATALIRCC